MTLLGGMSWYDLNGDGINGPGEPGLSNWRIYLDRDNDGVFNAGGTVNTSSADIPKPIPDLSTTTSVLNIDGLSGKTVDINVNLDISHTWNENLDVFLISPSGTSVELFTDVGDSSDNFSNTTLDDEATTSITSGTASFTGSFQAEGLLSAFDGENPNGTWTLQISDDQGGDVGTLNSWSLDITYGDLGTTTDPLGGYRFFNLPAGSYTVREELKPGWTQTTPANGFYNITLNPNDFLNKINFGHQWNPGQIQGRKWDDQNGNGVQDAEEPNLPGWTIYLDANNNGALDPGEISTTTNASGEYTFNDLVPGEYKVAEVMQPGWTQSNPGFNGSFERGNFTAWQPTGQTSLQTSEFGVTPANGTYQALLTTESGSVSDSDLETFLGLDAGSLDELIGGSATEGSALKKTITVSAGQQLSFNWNFLTSESTPSNVKDFAFVSISSGVLSKLADTNSSFSASASSFNQETGYSTFSHTFSTPGTYTISVGVLDFHDTAVKSALLVDNFTLTGGTGNLNSSIPVVIETGSIITDINFGNIRLTATEGNDFLVGTPANDSIINGLGGNDTIIGAAGNDTLIGGTGSDSMEGGFGNDIYNVDIGTDMVVEAAGGGVDTIISTVSRLLGAEQENLTLAGTAAINGFGNTLGNRIVGNAAHNELLGYGGNDTLVGGDGNDTLIGDIGRDSMAGGLGNDLYYVDIGTDTVVEAAGGGVDTVISIVSRLLGAEQENLTLAGTAAINGFGNTLGNRIVGNGTHNRLVGDTGNDTLIGGDGNDTLIGGTSSDSMEGGFGNDIYNVDIGTDIVVEAVGGGIDTVISTVSRLLGAEQENLTLAGTAAINGFGNTLGNRIVGNGTHNRLAGDAGNDTIIGGDGNDTLIGGTGSDSMVGGLGNDLYNVDIGTDMVVEVAGGGVDTIISTVSRLLGAEQENLTLAGTALVNGFGNTLGNRITGNGANNNLVGDAGNDTIIGGAGNDTVNGGAGNDSLVGSAGSDRFVYNTGAAFTTASVGVDTIADFISGATGDKFILDKTTFTSLNSIAGTGFTVAGEFRVVASDAAAATSTGEIVYNSVNGKLFYNPNGAGAGFSNVAGAGGLFATLTGAPTVIATDFLIQN